MRRRGHQEKTERNAEIVALVRAGERQSDVARRYGITRSRVWALCVRVGLPTRPRRVITKEMRERMIELTKNGLGLSHVASALDVANGSVLRALDAVGMAPVRTHDVFGDDARSKAVRLVKAGLTFMEAAEETGMTRNAVAGACRRAGVKVPEREKKDRHARGCERRRNQTRVVTKRELAPWTYCD